MKGAKRPAISILTATSLSKRGIAAWALGALFFCYGFFHRVSPSVMVEELMRDFDVGAAALGNLSAFYFYVYASIQIPVGLLLDRFGPRRLLAGSAALCGLGSLLFAMAGSLSLAYAGRSLIGLGAAFTWVGVLTIVTSYFPPTRFARFVGLAQMFGMVGAVAGQAPLASAVAAFGWRTTLIGAAGFGLVLALVLWAVIEERPEAASRDGDAAPGLFAGLRRVLRNPQTWFCALHGAAMTAPTLSFVGLWGVPWLVQVHGLSRTEAGSIMSVGFVGFGIGAPLMGWLSDWLGRRRIVMVSASAVGLAALLGVLYLPGLPIAGRTALILLHGLASGAMVVGFAAAREHNPPEASGAAYGLVNTFTVGSGALFQPLIGIALDWAWTGESAGGVRVYGADAYAMAFATLIGGGVIGLAAAFASREVGPRR